MLYWIREGEQECPLLFPGGLELQICQALCDLLVADQIPLVNTWSGSGALLEA